MFFVASSKWLLLAAKTEVLPPCRSPTVHLKTARLLSRLLFVVLFLLIITERHFQSEMGIRFASAAPVLLCGGAPPLQTLLSASSTALSSPPAPGDLFWSSRDQFLAAHVGSSNNNDKNDKKNCPESISETEPFSAAAAATVSSDQLKESGNFQFVRIPNDHQWEAEHLRGSRQHKVYQQLKYDTDRDRAEAIAQWTADETPVKATNVGHQLADADSEVDHLNPSGSDLGQQDSQVASSSGGGHSLGKQVIIWT